MQLPELKIPGARFVLTGRMWAVRKAIVQQIHNVGGSVEDRITPGAVLVIASNLLKQGRDGRWHTHESGTRKVQAAIDQGSLVYHEAQLRDTLRRQERFMSGSAVGARIKQPQWNDDLMNEMAALVAGMDETSELLAQF